MTDTHLSWECHKKGKPEVTECEGEVFVEEVSEELAHAVIGPAAVDQQQTLQKPELGHWVVWGQYRL